jgi:hypothetical protein
VNEVSDRLEADYTSHLATLEARSAAEKYLARLREGTNLDELAKTMNMKPETTGFFSRQDSPETIGGAVGLNDAAFKLSENNRYPDTVFENEDSALVIRWEGEQGVDKEKYEKEKGQYTDSLMYLKKISLYNAWLERLKAQADIDRSRFEKYK